MESFLTTMRLPPPLALLAFLVATVPLSAQPVISEFMADNETVLADEDGDFEDWIEICNAGASSLDLDGYYLTDDSGNLRKWRFPTGIVAAGGYVIVFASGKDRATAGSQLHTDFRLDADGEYLALVAPDGTTVVSEFGPAFPEQYPDISYGVQTQGTDPTLRAGQPGFLISHTPGAANTVIPGPHPLYCDTSLARIEITASQSVWNELQGSSPETPEGSVTFRYLHGDIDVAVTNVGISGRGNTGLLKHPRSFRISFNSFVPGQDLFGIEKLNLNSEANDPSTARSKLCFDIAAAAGLPAEYANHVATVIYGPNNHRSGPDGAFFDAVLNNTQPVDDVFVKQRFENTRGNLYKCTYTGAGPANLTYKGLTGSSYIGLSTYDLKYQGSTDGSYDDLAEFIAIINNTPTVDFPAVIRRHFDVDDFLKRLAIDVLTANWDGHWGNWNNFYLYRDPGSGKWNYIPFDTDNTFSIRWLGGDWAVQDMYNWGKSSNTPLVTRILAVDEFRHRYSYYMNRMVQTFYQNALLDPLVYRIRENQTAPLPFGGFGVTNCKFTDRDRYDGDWPDWTYSQYFNSYDSAQRFANPTVPNYYGITEFIAGRRASTLSQLNLVNIGPIISDIVLSPALPATNEVITVSARIEDDVQVSSASVSSSFDGGATSAVAMTDDGVGADTEAGDGLYTAQIGSFPTAGTLSYFVTATDNQSKSIYEPWGGQAAPAMIAIGSPYLGLAVTEINYHPHAPEGSELGVSTNANDYEFLELQNLGTSSLDLEDVEFIAGISYTFPAETLAPGERIVIVQDTAAFTVRYGSGINMSGEYGGQLSNGGEQLHLVDPHGVTIHDFSYHDTPPWPTRSDGYGSSLELLDANADDADASNWRPSIDYGGSPGAAGAGLPAGVVVNEALTHTDPPLVDAIELYNATEAAIDIGGWYLSDTDEMYKKFRIPPGTVLPAGYYIAFNETNDFNASMGSNLTDFALDSSHGDDVWLLQGDAQSNLVAFVDDVEFGAAINGESFGRWQNGAGEMVPMIALTLGGSNAGPRVGPVVISEFMYDPASGDPTLEFVEIFNGGVGIEDLGDWEITGDVDYTFPSNTVLSPDKVLVVLPFDPDLPANTAVLSAFRTHYGLGTNETLLGAYLGSLSDTGDTVRIRRPDSPSAEEPMFAPMLLEDEVDYGTDFPWPEAAAGGGPSLMRRGPNAWGNDPQSWFTAPTRVATPGSPPMMDADGDDLPDDYEIEMYGGTNVVGSSVTGDTDGDGADDEAEYIAGTSATDADSRLEIDIGLSTDGEVWVEFQTQPVEGPGYFGLDRKYDLEGTTELEVPETWTPLPGYSDLPATGDLVTYTNTSTNAVWSSRVRVFLE